MYVSFELRYYQAINHSTLFSAALGTHLVAVEEGRVMARTEPKAPSGVSSSKERLWLVSTHTTDVTDRSHMSNN
jgi:hypothetical protein